MSNFPLTQSLFKRQTQTPLEQLKTKLQEDRKYAENFHEEIHDIVWDEQHTYVESQKLATRIMRRLFDCEI
jgi:hypothetical protein